MSVKKLRLVAFRCLSFLNLSYSYFLCCAIVHTENVTILNFKIILLCKFSIILVYGTVPVQYTPAYSVMWCLSISAVYIVAQYCYCEDNDEKERKGWQKKVLIIIILCLLLHFPLFFIKFLIGYKLMKR